MTTSYIACVAGKSGGHIIPCLAYARTAKDADQKIIFFSNNTPLDYALLKNQPDIAHHQTYALSFAPSFLGILKMTVAFIKTTTSAYKILTKYRPTTIVSTGGFVSLPVFIAGWLLRIPCVLFELNAIPGKAARVCAFFASKIHVCFSAAAPYFTARKTVITPYPLRPEIKNALHAKNHTAHGKKAVLILGGSQGSVSLNNFIKKMISAHPDIHTRITIVHQTGDNDQTDWPAWYALHNIDAQTFPFCTNLELSYQQADIVITRAGAGTLFEIVAFKKKCIIIPLEIKQTDHQVDNALAMAQQYPDLCMVIREKEIHNSPDWLYTMITQ